MSWNSQELMHAAVKRVMCGDPSKAKEDIGELPFPLDDMASYISGDWGGDMESARAYIAAAWKMGFIAAKEGASPSLGSGLLFIAPPKKMKPKALRVYPGKTLAAQGREKATAIAEGKKKRAKRKGRR